MISEAGVIGNILDTITCFCEHDDRLDKTGPTAFKGKLELAGGLDVLEELQKVPNMIV